MVGLCPMRPLPWGKPIPRLAASAGNSRRAARVHARTNVEIRVPSPNAGCAPTKKDHRPCGSLRLLPLAEAVPPKLYGGTERVVSSLTEELVAQGHEVTLFASGDSETSAKLVPCVPQGLRLAGIRDHIASHLVMLNTIRRRADEFDVIHFHVDLLQHVLFQDLAHKCVTTLHGRLDLPDFWPVYYAFPHMPLVSISNDQRRPMPPHVNWLATVYHGLPSSRVPVSSEGG